MLNKLISGWAYNRDKNAFCSNFGQKRGVGVHSGVGLLSSEYGINNYYYYYYIINYCAILSFVILIMAKYGENFEYILQ